jgi:acetate---CoA ligase (ADP-forming)
MHDRSSKTAGARNLGPLLDLMIRPRTIAVIGASSTRQTLGNVALDNLAAYKFPGQIIPVHDTAREVGNLPAVQSIEALPTGVDVALASVPAAGVADVVRRLDRRGVPTVIVNTAGFSARQEAELRGLLNEICIVMHGPNCMGVINLTDATPIYTGGITSRVRPGPVALIAQSGSAAISLINSSTAGFSKVITIGSEYQVTGADYLHWLAGDLATSVVGLVLESIPDPDRFADAVDRVQSCGKSVVVLKVGRSVTGARATLAHTGALISSDDGFAAFVARHGVPLVNDYDEMVSNLEAFATLRRSPRHAHVAMMGISGGETALACDLCDDIDLPLADFSENTRASVRAALPGCSGDNPLDTGQTVGRQPDAVFRGMRAIMDAEEVGIGVILQDMQASLPPSGHRNYGAHLAKVAELERATDKPLVLISPTAEVMSLELRGHLADSGIPTLRGMRPGLVAVKNVAAWAARKPDPRRLGGHALGPLPAPLLSEIAGKRGPLPAPVAARLLAGYGLPLVKSVVARSVDDVMAKAHDIGYPMVVKVASRDVPHRSDFGAVVLGVASEADLRAAVERIERNVRSHMPAAVIDGFELQEELVDCVEAMVGFKATLPYGALIIVGTGGVLVELEVDKATSLCPVTAIEARTMITGTRLGRALGGYRGLIPQTDIMPLARLVTSLSELAAACCGVIDECDLNPVMIRKGSGEVRIVDALLVVG